MRWLLLGGLAAGMAGAQPVEFNREIRPILSDRCFACHGPDEKTRKAKLRLDTKDGLLGGSIVAGRPAQSELIARVGAAGEPGHMPPPKSGKKLTAAQVATLTRWVDQGAPWSAHWSFTAPVCAPAPALKESGWVRNPIDAFVLARLEAEGLKPAPEADRAALVRRLSLDLRGARVGWHLEIERVCGSHPLRKLEPRTRRADGDHRIGAVHAGVLHALKADGPKPQHHHGLPQLDARAALRREARDMLGEARKLESLAVERILDEARIVCATLTGLDSQLLGQRRYDIVVIDESSQVMPFSYRHAPPARSAWTAPSTSIPVTHARIAPTTSDGPRAPMRWNSRSPGSSGA